MSEVKTDKPAVITSQALKEAVQACEATRKHKTNPTDITLQEFVKAKYQMSMEQFYEQLKVNPTSDTVENIVNMPDQNYRWLIPEVIRDAIRLGLRKAPIYPNIIASEQNISQTEITMPAINMSEAMPKYVGIAETITVGDVSFQEKKVRIRKMGRGIKIPYEIRQYVALNILSIFLQDFGVKMGMGLDMLALDAAINGDQADGSDSAAVIGVATAGTLNYRDLIKPWVRGSRLGKTFANMVAGEDMAIDILDLFQYNNRQFGTVIHQIDLKTPIPSSSNLWVHGGIPNSQVLIVDPASALIKLNAQPLLVETEKIVSNQTEATYASITTGFATLFRDSRVVLDKSITYAANPFPAWMDPTYQETLEIQ